MHPCSSRWPRFLQASRIVLVVSMMLAIFELPAHAQGKERPVKRPTYPCVRAGPKDDGGEGGIRTPDPDFVGITA
jgi:hypothetical protein